MLRIARNTSFILVLSTLAACQPDADEVVAPLPQPAPQSLTIADFSHLAAGNYWVYQRYRVDSADNVINVLNTDSIFISGDSVVNGETYFVVHRNGFAAFQTSLWRDSADFLITDDHEVLFCADPLDELIYTEVEGSPAGVLLDYTVYSNPETITVPSGTFSTYKMQGEITSIGGFPEMAAWRRPRSYWAEDVGRVRYYEFFAFNPLGNRYDLVNYDVSH